MLIASLKSQAVLDGVEYLWQIYRASTSPLKHIALMGHVWVQVQHQLEAREEVVGIMVNPLLEPELTTPLLDVQGELRRGYSQC